jgi:hypothetical protein
MKGRKKYETEGGGCTGRKEGKKRLSGWLVPAKCSSSDNTPSPMGATTANEDSTQQQQQQQGPYETRLL